MLLASDFDQSRFLKGENYKQEKKYRIKGTTTEVLERQGKAEKKLIVWFTNSEQGLVLNKTNLRTLQGAFGDNTAGWVNKVIAVFPVQTEMGAGLRVRIPPPKQASQQPVTPGNGAAAVPLAVVAATPLAVVADPELDPDPVKPIGEDLDDEIAF